MEQRFKYILKLEEQIVVNAMTRRAVLKNLRNESSIEIVRTIGLSVIIITTSKRAFEIKSKDYVKSIQPFQALSSVKSLKRRRVPSFIINE